MLGGVVASCMVVQWLSRPRRPGFDTQTMHSFLVPFHLIKVVRIRILAEEEGGQRVYMLCMFLFYLTIMSFRDHVRLRDLPAQLNALLLSEAIRGVISPPCLFEIEENITATKAIP